jgi:RNase adaptor protein for sRNA GlmZ degradation
MNLVLLYGPPAVGKLTIAKELEKLTGYKLFDNHKIIDIVIDVFGYENLDLVYKIRSDFTEEAAKSGVDLITTGAAHDNNKFLYQGMVNSYRKHGGKACVVRLAADQDTLMGRMGHASRSNKLNSPDKLEEYLKTHPGSFDQLIEGEQLVIDTSNTEPQEAAINVVDYYHLK